MAGEVHLSRVEAAFDEHDYPSACDALADSCAGTTAPFADGQADLGELVGEIDRARFEDPGDAFAELQNVLPIGAVGEPGRSDGDA